MRWHELHLRRDEACLRSYMLRSDATTHRYTYESIEAVTPYMDEAVSLYSVCNQDLRNFASAPEDEQHEIVTAWRQRSLKAFVPFC